MKFSIDEKLKIIDIIGQFNEMFPYLKIDFFSNPSSFDPLYKKNGINNLRTLAESRRVQRNGTIVITPQMTVDELGKQFNNIYGLFVQVYRKSGKLWLETSLTDNWTLEEQNMQGKDLSSARVEE